jgi:hypothetical protein
MFWVELHRRRRQLMMVVLRVSVPAILIVRVRNMGLNAKKKLVTRRKNQQIIVGKVKASYTKFNRAFESPVKFPYQQ